MLTAIESLLIYAVLLPIYMLFKLKRVNQDDLQVRFRYGFLYLGLQARPLVVEIVVLEKRSASSSL